MIDGLVHRGVVSAADQQQLLGRGNIHNATNYKASTAGVRGAQQAHKLSFTPNPDGLAKNPRPLQADHNPVFAIFSIRF